MLLTDFSKIEGFSKALDEAPELLAQELVKAFAIIGKHDNELIRSNATAGLKTRNRGVAKAFKFKSADGSKIKNNTSNIFVDFYSKWKASDIFERGGVVNPAIAGALTILTDAAKGKGGKRKWTSQQIVTMIDSGEMRLIKTGNGWLIVQSKGGYTKTGKIRKGTRDEIIAIIRKNVTQRKRISFYDTVKGQESFHVDAIETAVENVFLKLEMDKRNEGAK